LLDEPNSPLEVVQAQTYYYSVTKNLIFCLLIFWFS